MACYHPIKAYKGLDGKMYFKNAGPASILLELPCGRCIGCRIMQSEEWAIRVMHEASMHEENCVITLTYNEENCPTSLKHSDVQKFLKKLRLLYNIRYFMGGEYGGQNGRPHYHIILFGVSFIKDRIPYGKSQSGYQMYESKTLNYLWGKGHAIIQELALEMARYVAKYCLKKLGKQSVTSHEDVYSPVTGEIYNRRSEYGKMSLKPGIGQKWIQRYHTDITNTNTLIINGKEVPIPRFYRNYLKNLHPDEYLELKRERREKAEAFKDNSTVERLRVRETSLKRKQKARTL